MKRLLLICLVLIPFALFTGCTKKKEAGDSKEPVAFVNGEPITEGDLDKLTNLAIEGSLSHYKMIVSFLGNDESTAKKLVERTKSAVGNRSSGFTRIVKLPARRGDNAQMARLEWVDKVEVKTKGVSDKSKKEDRKGKVSGVEKKDISSKETKKPGLLGRLKKSVGSK